MFFFRFKQSQISWTIVKDQLSLFRHSISHWLSPFTLSCTSSNPKRPGFTKKSLALVMSCPSANNGTCRLHRLSATAVSRRWRACPPPAPAHSGPVTVLPPSWLLGGAPPPPHRLLRAFPPGAPSDPGATPPQTWGCTSFLTRRQKITTFLKVSSVLHSHGWKASCHCSGCGHQPARARLVRRQIRESDLQTTNHQTQRPQKWPTRHRNKGYNKTIWDPFYETFLSINFLDDTILKI